MGERNTEMEDANNRPVVGVVVPFYNYGKYIGDCLKSIWTDQNIPIEVVVVDDCSNAEHGDIARQECWKYPGTSYVRLEDNCGVSVARNTGIRMTSAPFITCLDADDMLTPGSLKVRVDKMRKRPEAGLVYGRAYKINEARANSEWSYDECMAQIRTLEVYSRWINAQALLWRRSVFVQFGLYYEKLRSKEDKEFIVRLGLHPEFKKLKKRIKAVPIDDIVAIYRRHEGAKHRMRCADKRWYHQTEQIFDARILQLRKEWLTKENTSWL